MEIFLRRKPSPTTSATDVDGDVKPQNVKKDLIFDDLELADSDREDYHNNVDILFVLDTTGSMGSYIAQAMTTIKKIVEKFSKMEFNIKFALCTYRDHPPQDSTYVTEFTDLTSAKKLLNVLSTVSAAGGGDGPEAVMDGLREGLTKSTWRLGEDKTTISKRFIFHICDAPPHGNEYGGSSSDPEWQKKGCPCGTKKEDINNLLKEKKVDYHLIKASTQVNQMEEVFKKCFTENFSETIVLNESQPDTHTELKTTCDVFGATEAGECCVDDEEYEEEEEEEEEEDCQEEKEEQEEIHKEPCVDGITTISSKKETKEISKSFKKKLMVSESKIASSLPSSSLSSYKPKKEMWEGVLNVLDKKLL